VLTDSPDFARGRLAYEAYLDAVDGNSPVTGDALPDFEDCPELVQEGWIAAALAVRRDTLQR
jgi:hypothetical protein